MHSPKLAPDRRPSLSPRSTSPPGGPPPLTLDTSPRTLASSSSTVYAHRSSRSLSLALALERHTPPSPVKPIPYPYPSSLPFLLRSTLRPRRRRSSSPLPKLARRWLGLLLALSLPILGLMLAREYRTHAELSKRTGGERGWAWAGHSKRGREVDLQQLRREYEARRRKEIALVRTPGWDESEKKRGKRKALDGEMVARGDMGDVGWSPEDEAELRREVEDAWPEWWGSSAVVGKGPFDHSPPPLGPGEEKKRILFLTDYRDYLERMNTHTYEIVDAALRHPQVIVDVWGPGWAGYNRSVPLSTNIRRRAWRIHQLEESRRAHQAKLDAAERDLQRRQERAWYSSWGDVSRAPREVSMGLEGGDAVEVWQQPEWTDEWKEQDGCAPVQFEVAWTISDIFKQDDPHVDVLDCGVLLVQQVGDCHSHRCLKEWYPHANNITLSKYAFELAEVFGYDNVKGRFDQWEMGILGHSPDTANEWDFYPVPWKNKMSDATTFGFDGSFYPIRTKINDHVKRADGESRILRHAHPGYTLSVPQRAWDHPLETYEEGHEYYAQHRMLRADFARGMREARICVFDASLERKMIRKYAQALLSGCVVAADLPTEHEEDLARFVIPLNPAWSIERIHQELDKYLADEQRLHQMAMDGVVYARKHFTTTRKVSEVLRMAADYRQGVRGYDFGSSWSSRCRSYWEGNDHRPPWCTQEGYRGLE